MITQSVALALLRAQLNEASAVNFTDANLISFMNSAISELDGLLLKQKKGTITRVAGQTEYSHPTDSLFVIDSIYVGTQKYDKVEELTRFLEETATTDYFRFYYTYDKIVFNQDPGSNPTILYRAQFVQYSGASVACDCPSFLDPLIILGGLIRANKALLMLLGASSEKYPDLSEEVVRRAIRVYQDEFDRLYKKYQGMRIGTASNTPSYPLRGPVATKTSLTNPTNSSLHL